MKQQSNSTQRIIMITTEINKFIHLISKEEYLAPFYISVCIAIPFIIFKDILFIDNPEGTLYFELLCLYTFETCQSAYDFVNIWISYMGTAIGV